MDLGEIVESSDAEERESGDALDFDYWLRATLPPSPLPPNDPTPQDHEAEFARYSLRTRQPKQVKPYAYDRVTYQQQMKSNPDAIIKFHSRKDYGGGVETEEDWKMDLDGEVLDGVGRRRQRKQGASLDANIGAEKTSGRGEKWYPKLLDEWSSSDEEDTWELRKEAKKARNEMEVTQKDNKSTSLRNIPTTSVHPIMQEDASYMHFDNFLQDKGIDVIKYPIPHPTSPLGSTRNSPIVVHCEDEGSPSPRSSEISSSASCDIESSKDRKRLRALRRMMPAFMIPGQLQNRKKPPPKRRQHSLTPDPESDVDDGLLLPGQTRIRPRVGEHHENVLIRGDSESSDEKLDPEHCSNDDCLDTCNVSNSDDELCLSGPPRHSFDSFSSDDDVDDTKINAWLGRATTSAVSRPRKWEGSLIDWMLSRTRTVGGNSKVSQTTGRRRVTNCAPRSRRHGLDIIVGKALKHGHERQSLLSFHKDHRDSKSEPTLSRGSERLSPGRTLPAAKRRRSIRNDNSESNIPPAEDSESNISAALKRERKRHRHNEQSLLYTFSSTGTRIISGRQRENTITVDLQDSDFHQALAVRSRDMTSNPAPMGPSSQLARRAGPTFRQEVSEVLGFDSAMYHNLRAPHPHKLTSPRIAERGRDIKVDCDVPFLMSGISFRSDTYLGRLRLQELTKLVSGVENAHEPEAFEASGFRFVPTMCPSDFIQTLRLICDGLLEYLAAPHDDHATGISKQWEAVMNAVCRHASWLVIGASEEDCNILEVTAIEPLQQLVDRIEYIQISSSIAAVDSPKLTLFWFAIELSARLQSALKKRGVEHPVTSTALRNFVMALVQYLHEYGLPPVLESIKRNPPGGLDSLSTPQRAAEIWICLFHLLDGVDMSFEDNSDPPLAHPLWTVVCRMLKRSGQFTSGLEASENAWSTIFGLCAISQFSINGLTTSECRLPASWEVAALALKLVSVVADPERDKGLSGRTLSKRDEYIRLLMARCFTLWSRWRWRLNGDKVMFNHLYEIFKSRKFANLRQEPSDLPNFLLKNDMHLLAQHKSSDTAFEIFLKLVAQADDRPDGPDKLDHPLSARFKKLLSLVTPKATVPFTKANPPTKHELSILYNTLGAVGVAIYLDPSSTSIQYRLAEARRCVNFKQADDNTRLACIRGIMHFAILLRHRCLPLRDMLLWLKEITNVLVDEFKEIDAAASKTAVPQSMHPVRDRVVISIQILLGSVRRIIETPIVNRDKEYPDPALLDGPWVERIFSANLAHMGKTEQEIRRLVQAFLDARFAVMSCPQRTFRSAATGDSEDSQESQDEYGALCLDQDDDDLRAALGEETHIKKISEIKVKDEEVCKVIEKDILLPIYGLVCMRFNDLEGINSFDDYCEQADMWIDCWVGCASIVVHNKKKEWSFFLALGPQSWQRIINASWRRRVGLRFMFMLLKVDPKAYVMHKEKFLEVLLESMVSPKVTMENEYVSLLFSIDGLEHPLLHGIPCGLAPGAAEYKISRLDFVNLRFQILDAIFTNLSSRIRDETAQGGLCQTSVGATVAMFSTMRNVYQQLEQDPGQAKYGKLCKRVVELLRKHPELELHHRLLSWVEWGSQLVA